MSQSLPLIAQRGSYRVPVQAGKSYWWCACGMSKSQPFCDGSHKGSGFSPVEYKADADGEIGFCGCKRSGKAPRCDGTHNRLP